MFKFVTNTLLSTNCEYNGFLVETILNTLLNNIQLDTVIYLRLAYCNYAYTAVS